jgi:hypothetical protein
MDYNLYSRHGRSFQWRWRCKISIDLFLTPAYTGRLKHAGVAASSWFAHQEPLLGVKRVAVLLQVQKPRRQNQRFSAPDAPLAG